MANAALQRRGLSASGCKRIVILRFSIEYYGLKKYDFVLSFNKITVKAMNGMAVIYEKKTF